MKFFLCGARTWEVWGRLIWKIFVCWIWKRKFSHLRSEFLSIYVLQCCIKLFWYKNGQNSALTLIFDKDFLFSWFIFFILTFWSPFSPKNLNERPHCIPYFIPQWNWNHKSHFKYFFIQKSIFEIIKNTCSDICFRNYWFRKFCLLKNRFSFDLIIYWFRRYNWFLCYFNRNRVCICLFWMVLDAPHFDDLFCHIYCSVFI